MIKHCEFLEMARRAQGTIMYVSSLPWYFKFFYASFHAGGANVNVLLSKKIVECTFRQIHLNIFVLFGEQSLRKLIYKSGHDTQSPLFASFKPVFAG